MSAVQPPPPRRGSLLERLGNKMHRSKEGQNKSEPSSGLNTTNTINTTIPSSSDAGSTFSGETITSRTGIFHRRESADASGKKPRRERICDNGPFKLVVDPVTGRSRLVENNRWPPGVEYETPNRYTPNQGLNSWYQKRGGIVGGGDGAANVGPDPDWIPGLSKEEREEIKKQKDGWYVF